MERVAMRDDFMAEQPLKKDEEALQRMRERAGLAMQRPMDVQSFISPSMSFPQVESPQSPGA